MTPRWVITGGGLVAIVLIAHSVHALTHGPDSSALLSTWAYNFVLAGSAAGCLARAWVTPENRRQWTLTGAGLVAWAVGEVWLAISDSAPGVTDASFVVLYILLLIGIGGLYRKDRAARGASFWLDAVTGS